MFHIITGASKDGNLQVAHRKELICILIWYKFLAAILYTQIYFQITAQHSVDVPTLVGHEPQPYSRSYNTWSNMQRVMQFASHKQWNIHVWHHSTIS
jgi:hypothetical protein